MSNLPAETKGNVYQKTIAFIGCGNLCASLVQGLVKEGYNPDCLWVTNRTQEKNDHLAANLRVHASLDNLEAAAKADVLVLGVKPQQMQAVCESLASTVQAKKPLVISVAVGVTTDMVNRWLGGEVAVVRTMPNTPALIGTGATGLYSNDRVSESERAFAESIMRAVGVAIWVKEEYLIDVVASLSGSGPAYFFLFIESLQAAATKLGLPEEDSKVLALQTALGASKLAYESAEEVAVLREQVTSPKGTTEEALRVFREGGLEQVTEAAMRAAIARAEALVVSLDQ